MTTNHDAEQALRKMHGWLAAHYPTVPVDVTADTLTVYGTGVGGRMVVWVDDRGHFVTNGGGDFGPCVLPCYAAGLVGFTLPMAPVRCAARSEAVPVPV